MDNQHRKIKGYRELDQAEIDAINSVKELGIDIEMLLNQISEDANPDGGWLVIAKTDLQKGLMALTRSIANPDFF
jgi:hypothetical protein